MTKRLIYLIFFLYSAISYGQGFEKGDLAPEIVMEGLDGNPLKLSSLRGKVVLIDFWASWCKPCRKENPEVVKMYNKYKDEAFENGDGFAVFNVSLDSKRPMWEKAVADDQLNWKYHVCDFKGWYNEAAKTYGISSIPQSYLIDGDGKIIAVNPRGEKLEKELKKYKKSSSWFSNWF